MSAIKLKPVDEVPALKLENREVTLLVEKKTGWIRSCFFKKKKVDIFQQLKGGIPGYIGGLRIYDELDEVWYSDLNDSFTLSSISLRNGRITFTKKFRGAPFTVKVTLALNTDGLEWDVEVVKKNSKVADRSLRIYFVWPLIAGWDFWAPAYDGEFTFDGMSSFEYMYVQIPYVSNKEIILPAVSHFSKDLDVGYTMVEPIDRKIPAAKFQFSNGEKCYNWGAMKKDIRSVPVLEAVNYYIGLVGNRRMKTGINLMFHEGDWRPGVGKVFKKWKEFFVPSCDTIYRKEGVFTCEGVQSADDIKRCRDFGIKTMEIHGHFESYSDYYQAGKDTWPTVGTKESFYHLMKEKGWDEWDVQQFFESATPEEIREALIPVMQQRGFKDYPNWKTHHSRKDIIRRLKKLTSSGIGCYWYFNYTDGFRPFVEKRWPDSIAENEDGSPQPSGWHGCHNMNADPKWSFGKFCIRSAKQIVKTYPMLSGFFLDCFRHFEIDFAHDDGITVVNHKPAYSMNFSYDGCEKTIKALLNKHKMSTFANKPQSIRSMRWSDGVLLEGDGNFAEEKFFWACIAKPLFFMWTSDKKSIDENLRRAVYHGSFPKYDFDRNRSYAKNKELYDRYLPLSEQFRRRILCFEADPMRVPHGCRGKLYTIGRDYIAGIMNEHISEEAKVRYTTPQYAAFRVKAGHDIGKVGVMTPGDRKFRFVKFSFDGTFISVPLEGFSTCAVVKLFSTKRTGRRIGKERFREGVDYCGDPESSFDDARNKR